MSARVSTPKITVTPSVTPKGRPDHAANVLNTTNASKTLPLATPAPSRPPLAGPSAAARQVAPTPPQIDANRNRIREQEQPTQRSRIRTSHIRKQPDARRQLEHRHQ